MFELNYNNASEPSFQTALEKLQIGEIIAIHTNQYYTIVCNAIDTEAVNQLKVCAQQCNMHITVMMASEREILYHTASIDLAIFDALTELETTVDFPIVVLCNNALNLAVGVENTLGQFLLHKTTNELMKQLIKRLRNPICCLQITPSSKLDTIQKLHSTLNFSLFKSIPFFRANVYQLKNNGILQLKESDT